eukprot:CAMPEP_0172841472 /NCGR_PEP_ID=MMETSP1075-20121228/30012_1 /TAXON_ID=2916 /ORGANISM="Ceratium fusus, Strain PA161109" /LENGTH=120 /DNA_ID=CAMNT_0013685447 /DNA_START=244 /DNA_END=603 /DNA_ORIENTATION=+
MNITLVSLWGMVNFVQAIIDSFTGAYTLMFHVFSMRTFTILVIVAIPIVELTGASLAWGFFAYHEASGGPFVPLLSGKAWEAPERIPLYADSARNTHERLNLAAHQLEGMASQEKTPCYK